MRIFLTLALISALTACGGSSGGAQNKVEDSGQRISETTNPNNSIGSAQTISIGVTVEGTLTEGQDDTDYYRFDVASLRPVEVELSAAPDFDLALFSTDGTVSLSSIGFDGNERISDTLSGNTYFITVTRHEGSGPYLLTVR